MVPIQTVRKGDKITKVVVEDFYKVINRVYEALDKNYEKASNILESVHKQFTDNNGETYEGELIIGTGVSQPSGGDQFNEEIGNEIAFKKAKLNANLKKLRILDRVLSSIEDLHTSILLQVYPLDKSIQKDMEDLNFYKENEV